MPRDEIDEVTARNSWNDQVYSINESINFTDDV